MSIQVALVLAAQGHAPPVVIPHGQLGQARLVVLHHHRILSPGNAQNVHKSIIHPRQRDPSTDILAHRIEFRFGDQIEVELLLLL